MEIIDTELIIEYPKSIQELAEKVAKMELMGLFMENCSGSYPHFDVYVSVPKDGDKVLEDMPAVYGSKLAKYFQNALREAGDGYSYADRIAGIIDALKEKTNG